MILLSRSLWLAQTNTYVVASEPGGPAVVVDVPPDPSAVLEMVRRHDLSVAALLVTHGHVDHVGGAGPVAEATGAYAYVHPDDDFLTDSPEEQLRLLFGMVPPGDYRAPAERVYLAYGQRHTLAGVTFEVLHTPGHTPGHCCFLVEEEGILFSGDQLFAGSIGRTDLPGGDLGALAESMRTRVMTLPDDIRVLPGHGPETTIGEERRSNPFRHLWS